LGAVSGEVQAVRTDMKDLSSQIAHNGDELAELRRRGERDYYEFDVSKGKDFARIADVLVQLRSRRTGRISKVHKPAMIRYPKIGRTFPAAIENEELMSNQGRFGHDGTKPSGSSKP
jgi:hypothetical protein